MLSTTLEPADEFGHQNRYGYYLYGVTSGDGDLAGSPEQDLALALAVYTLPYGNIRAIVSRVSLEEFGPGECEKRLKDVRWLEAKVRTHETVVEAFCTRQPVIPMRFGTVFKSQPRIQEALATHYQHLVEALRWLRDKREWGVKVCFHRKRLARGVENASPMIQELRAQTARHSPGASYLLTKRLERALADETERVIDECARCSHARLSGAAEEAVSNAVQSRQITGREEEMILNGAYLVSAAQWAEFRHEVEGLRDEYRAVGFEYMLTGPWPPYSFARIPDEAGDAGG